MKTSLEWLQQYLPGALSPEAAAEALTNGGLPVEVIERVGDDTVIDVEVTSNRGDCLSHVGVARELSALMNRQLKEVQPTVIEVAVPAVTSVKIEALDLCPHYTARVIRNVKIKPSPAWMQRRLEAVGLRPINNVVDVTNYVMFELGQPLHAFDFDRLEGRRIIVRRAKMGETLVSIDGHERRLNPGMLVIADAFRPVALAGVMGGRDSEVSEATTNVLLESARFDALTVRRTARALMMRSDSSYRFERGIDPLLPESASLRAAQLILETAGGELLSGVAEAGGAGAVPKKLSLRLSKLKQVLGVELPIDSVVDALRRLRMQPVHSGDRIDVTVPSYRLDINIEADLVEEVSRVVGYDKIPVRDQIQIRVTAPETELRTLGKIRDSLVSAGYFEAVTMSFVSDAMAGEFTPPGARSLPRTDANVRKADAHLRPSILPGLLEAVRRNETGGVEGAKLFETGSVFWYDASGKLEEHRRVALAGSGDVHEVRGTIEGLLTSLNADRAIRIVPEDRPGFARGAAGRIEWDGKPVGHLGKIDVKLPEKLSLRSAPVAAELELNALLTGAQLVPQLHPLPRFPAVRRDLSFVLPETTRYQTLESVVQAARPENLETIEYVTTYRGKPLAKGSKSVTITLVFRSPAETLTTEQVDTAVQKVTAAAQQKLNATLRA